MKANVDLSKVCGLRAARCALAPDAFLVLNENSLENSTVQHHSTRYSIKIYVKQ